MMAALVQTGINNRLTRLRRCLLAAMVTLPLPALAAAPQTCGTVIVPPGVGLGTPPASVQSLSPLLTQSLYDSEAAGLLYYGLLWVNRAHKIDWSRSLATKIDVSNNNTTFTVTMKPWSWSDGRPVTSKDVAFTYHLIKRLGPTYLNYGTGGIPTLIKHFKVLGPEQFQVVMKHPVNPNWFEIEGLPGLTPYPAHAWGKYTINQMYRRQSTPSFFKVVDGPYQVQTFKMGRYVSFVPNPAYQGHKSQISRFVMDFLHSSGAEIEAIRAGAIDVSNVPFSLWTVGHSLKGVRLIKMPPNFGFDYIQLNYRNPKVAFFHELRVRQAIADAIDQKAEIALLFHGQSHEQYGPVPVDPPLFLSPSAKAGKYPVGYDPAKARKLLDEAGWKLGPDGFRTKNGKLLAFTYLQYSGGTTAALRNQMIQQNLRAIGIDMKIRQVTFNQLLALQQRPLAWEAMAFGWSLGSYPSDSGQLKTGGSYNQAGYSDKKLDRLMEDIRVKSGNEALYKYQDYASEQQPEIFMPNPGSVVIARDGLRGIRKTFSPTGSWSPQYLHFTTPPCSPTVADNTAP
ncbi:MAG: peptide ABC transporter substrate-binding protein [Acidiphilium sp.]|nr:peptide ABC transporter substrate-binding protein [Acidiphilium sp.]MDD4935599.1 peptide ABC transporter substrate-binding protein [Acidiphilium sp.]